MMPFCYCSPRKLTQPYNFFLIVVVTYAHGKTLQKMNKVQGRKIDVYRDPSSRDLSRLPVFLHLLTVLADTAGTVLDPRGQRRSRQESSQSQGQGRLGGKSGTDGASGGIRVGGLSPRSLERFL